MDSVLQRKYMVGNDFSRLEYTCQLMKVLISFYFFNFRMR